MENKLLRNSDWQEPSVIKTKRKPTGAAAMGAGPGRPKGSTNKVTTEFREIVGKLLQVNAGNFEEWIQQVATGSHGERPDPARALDLLAKLAEYAAPKLGRVEHVGDGGGPIKQERTVTFVKPE
jgi:hypothetical protein